MLIDTIAKLLLNDGERVVMTFTESGVAWHLLRDRREIPFNIVKILINGDDASLNGRLVPVGDGLVPGVSQTFRWEPIFATLQKIPEPRRKRGRPRNPVPPADAATRMAQSRERKALRDLQTHLLVAALLRFAPPDEARRLETHPVFGPIVRQARIAAKVVTKDFDGLA